MSVSFARFMLVGLANTFVGFGAILGFQFVLGLSPVSANACGYAIGMSLSYFLNRRYSFRSQRSHRAGVPAFLAASGTCYGLNLIVLNIASSVAWIPPALAQALAVACYTFAFYAISRRLVFTQR